MQKMQEIQGLIPGSGRSPGGGHGNPLQYSCLENPSDRGAWGATVHGVAKELGTTGGTEQARTHRELIKVEQQHSNPKVL